MMVSRGFQRKSAAGMSLVGRNKSLYLEEGCPHPVEILTISTLKWCNLVHFAGLIYVNTGMI